ncbi:MAG: SGNH/GDSL hydrolase family protein [Cyanobacteriota bacterium]|nr:SGNH/GDSL hydrolase family protein [Cyanobacteriota bacterium]
MTSPSRRAKQIGLNLLLSLGGVGAALGIMEIALRILGISYPSFYDVDEYRGHALIPNFAAEWTHEGRGRVEINSRGLRDGEHDIPKPPGTYRIAVLGDSFSEAIQVEREQTYWSVLEQKLAQCPALKGKTVEVVNFGVGDYGTAQQLMTLKTQVPQYEPDLVLLQVFTGNDLVNNSRSLSPPDRLAPFWVKNAQGVWEMDLSFQETSTYQRRRSGFRKVVFTLINYSRVLQVLNEGKRVLSQGRPLAQTQGANTLDALIPSLDFDPNLYQAPPNEDWRQAWEATESLIENIHRESQTLGADFILATLSNPPQVYPQQQPALEQVLQKQGAQDLFYPDRRLAQFAQKQGFTAITLAPDLQTYSRQNNVFLHGFPNTAPGVGHWNALGHRVAGEKLAAQLCSAL